MSKLRLPPPTVSRCSLGQPHTFLGHPFLCGGHPLHHPPLSEESDRTIPGCFLCLGQMHSPQLGSFWMAPNICPPAQTPDGLLTSAQGVAIG